MGTEDRQRFDAARREAYAKYLASVAQLALKVKGGSAEAHQDLVAEWLARAAEIEIVATPAVQKAAEKLTKSVNDDLFNPAGPRDVNAWYDTRQAFLAAVRTELAITVP